jgi:hypothetical protein
MMDDLSHSSKIYPEKAMSDESRGFNSSLITHHSSLKILTETTLTAFFLQDAQKKQVAANKKNPFRHFNDSAGKPLKISIPFLIK